MTTLKTSKTKGLDREYILLVLQLESEIDGLSRRTAEKMAKAVLKQRSATAPLRDQDSLITELVGLLALYFKDLNSKILNAQVGIATVRADNAAKIFLPILRNVRAYNEANKLAAELKAFPENVRKTYAYYKHGPDMKNYEGRIKSVQQGAEKTVRNIVENGVKKGLSADQIAKKIEQYVNPSPTARPTRPYDEYRERFSKPQNSKVTNVRPGSVRTNARMIARTETAEVYRNATERIYGKKRWVKGYRWVLSNSHPKTDICDSLAHEYSKNDSRPWSHPHCVCDWQAVAYSEAEMAEMVAKGEMN